MGVSFHCDYNSLMKIRSRLHGILNSYFHFFPNKRLCHFFFLPFPYLISLSTATSQLEKRCYIFNSALRYYSHVYLPLKYKKCIKKNPRIPDSKATNSTSYLKIRMKKIIHFKNVFQRFLSKFSKINSCKYRMPDQMLFQWHMFY